MKSVTKTQFYFIGFVAIASLLIFLNSTGHTSFTESENTRFNQWVTYFSECKGYTVEYKNFDIFKSESDTTTLKQAGNMASDIREIRDNTGSVTVYFDWENNVIFYSISSIDLKLQYCYYCRF